MVASKCGHLEVVRLLLKHGAKLNLQNGLKWAALMRAVDFGCIKVVKVLLEHDTIQVDLQNSDGNSALMLAAEKQNNEAAKLLLDKNADINLLNFNGESPCTDHFLQGQQHKVGQGPYWQRCRCQ